MGFSAPTAHIVFFIGAVMITAAFVHDSTPAVLSIADSFIERGETDSALYRTAIRFVNDPGSVPNDPVRLYVLNTGSRAIAPELVTIVVDGEATTDRTITELGTVDSAWRNGEVVRITLTDLDLGSGLHHFVISVPPGVTDTLRPVMTGPNFPPDAAFTYTTTPLNIAVDASTTTDPNGDTLTYAWLFGDGAGGSGVTSSRTYAAAGTYNVNLTVSDGQGGLGYAQQAVLIYADFVHTHEVSHRLTGQHLRSTVTVYDHVEGIESGVTVSAQTCKSGGSCTTYSDVTKADGTVEFTWSSIGSGTYTTCVTDLVKANMWWDQAAGHATGGGGNCRTQTV